MVRMDLVRVHFECDNGHDIDMNIPFPEEYIIIPCPTCGLEYIVNNAGSHRRFKHKMIQFPALHFD
jgi:predicted RNA-binding Zn-ribbon protein involved in translation (DUF1610 family)